MASARVSLRAYGISLVLLLLTVPWLDMAVLPLGMPAWAAFSLVATVAYAVVVALGLRRVFDGSDGDGRSDGGAAP